MANSVGDRDGTALRMAEEREFVESGGVDNHLQIVHPGFERNVRDIPGGETVSAAVVSEDAGASGKIAHPVTPDRAFPFEIEMIETVCDFDQRVAGADGGVREANLVRCNAETDF